MKLPKYGHGSEGVRDYHMYFKLDALCPVMRTYTLPDAHSALSKTGELRCLTTYLNLNCVPLEGLYTN